MSEEPAVYGEPASYERPSPEPAGKSSAADRPAPFNAADRHAAERDATGSNAAGSKTTSSKTTGSNATGSNAPASNATGSNAPASNATGSSPADDRSFTGGQDRRVRARDLLAAKQRHERWAMLTSYDQCTARIFDAAGIPVLLVGDSAANNVLGYATTLPVTVDELVPMVRAVAGATRRALIVADLPFGSYEEGPTQALRTAVRFMKESGCHAVKLEGGRRYAAQIEAITAAGIPVMAHVGFTPQRVHTLGGYRVQGRGEAVADVVADAHTVAEAGAFAVVLEMVTAEVAKRVTHELEIPTVGIGAGPDTDAQVLVWQDMAGLRGGPLPRFVKQYADLAGVLADATHRYAEDVRSGVFPSAEHTFH